MSGWKHHSVLPGFRLTLGFTLVYLLLIVLIPLAGLFVKTAELTPQAYFHALTAPRVLHAFALTFGMSLLAALVNALFGLIVAWVLARYDFPGKRIVDAAIDLPFALPTAVAGIALSVLYAPQGWIGKLLPFNIAFTPLGIFIALLFVGLPFAVRALQPVIADLDREVEEAAEGLGATRRQIFTRVIFPSILPALAAGFAMAFARGLGEYGSVIFIAGNLPNVSEIVPLIIVIKLEQYDIAGATAVASTMLVISLVLLLSINTLQRRIGHRMAMP